HDSATGYTEGASHPPRGKHREPGPYVERLQELADAVGDIPLATAFDALALAEYEGDMEISSAGGG
ncbi:MAG TPA: hypothetical protein VK821_08580, partial [Dehalococcoidia bacterium]|nr:hypothetical protein [Dehalococcoidia bacterium]